MNTTIPIGPPFALLENNLGRAGAIAALRSALWGQQIPSVAGLFHAALENRSLWHDAPANGSNRQIPHQFWGASWGGSGEWTEVNHGYVRHFKSNWERGDFVLIEELGPRNNILRLSDVRIGAEEFAALCARLGVNAERAGSLGHLIDWVRNCEVRGWKSGWRKYKDQLGPAAEIRDVFRKVWEKERGILPRGKPAESI